MRKKKIKIKKARVKFVFRTNKGEILSNKNSRLKIMGNGGVSCLRKVVDKWTSIKGDIVSIKIIYELVTQR